MGTTPPVEPSASAPCERTASCRDAWGLAITTQTGEAACAYGRALLALLGHSVATLEHVDAALGADPALLLGHVFRGFALRLLARRELLPEVLASLEQAQEARCLRGASAREALLLDALSAWCAGAASRAIAALHRASIEHPRCLLSLKLHHALCFMYGETGAMRSHLEQLLPRLSPHLPGYGYALGCYAFALEESGDYGAAEATAREALARCPDDAWAYHALLHVFSAAGRSAAGLELVRSRGARLARGNFGAHIAWHHALLAIAERELDEALALYDREIATGLGRDYRDFVNCASLLQRLALAGKDVGDRWAALAALAEASIGDHVSVFADAHYVLALLRGGERGRAETFVASVRASVLSRCDEDAQIARRVGLPLVDGLLALARGDARAALRGLSTVAPKLHELGGSQLQRELFSLLRTDAARALSEPALDPPRG